MGPLSRIVLSAVLSALLGGQAFAHGGRGQHIHVMPAGTAGADVAIDAGTCSGTSRTPPPPVLDGPPFDLRKTPVPNDSRWQWTGVGYTFDDAAGRILRADKKPLPEAEYRRLLAPFDAAAEHVEALLWVGLMTQGVRLDEKTCFLYGPGSKEPVTRLEMLGEIPASDKGLEFIALSNLRATLRGMPGDRPIPADVAARLKAANESGAKLPQSVLDAIARGAPSREILAGTDAAYTSLTRYYDGERDAESLVRGALPYVPGINEPGKPRALIGTVEERLAAALSKDLEARFATHEAGREMMERFRDKDGVVRLPVIRVLKLSQRPDDPGYGKAAAIQDTSNGSVIINHWVAARIAVDSAPPGQREALARDLADASKLNARLLKDPALRLQVLKGVEIIIAHEFVHAWQNRRSKYDVETMRGNLPSSNPLEKEHEAYREEYRYFHSLLKTHPADAVRSSELPTYQFVLSDYAGYRTAVTQMYMGTFAGSSDFQTVSRSQEDRRSLAQRLQGESLGQWVRQGLKLIGYEQGDKAMREAVAEDARRDRDFRDKELPRMQAESQVLLPKAYESAGRPDLALGYAVEHWTSSRADAQRYVRGTLSRLAGTDDALYDRVRAINNVQKYYTLVKEPPPPAVETAWRRDYPLVTLDLLSNAEKALTPEARTQALENARLFAEFLKDKALIERVRAAQEKKK